MKNELRIGNWIYDAQCEMEIQIGTGSHIHNLDPNSNPIPLTEEWLKRVGFDASGFKQQEFLNWGFKVKKDPNSPSNWITFQGFMNQFYELTSIQYVHQLQNLYFALTGEELTIK